MEAVEIPARRAEVIGDVDVVVCGAGPAGLGAALAAARSGATVALLERYGFLGGNFTAAAVGTVCGLYVRTAPGSFDLVTGGLMKQFTESLTARGGGGGPIPFKDTAVFLYVPWVAKRLCDHLVTEGPAAARITLLLHALVSDVIASEDGGVAGVVIASKQGPKVLRARVVVDATGDADVAAHAGVPTTMGGPGERQFGSMQFYVQQVDVAAAMTAGLETLQTAISEHGAHLTRDGGAVLPTFRAGEMIGAMVRLSRDGAPLDGTDLVDLTWGELEGRRRAEEAMEFLAEHMPGFASAFLADTATQQGVRETRHIRGRDTLRGGDVAAGTGRVDSIAAAAWPQEYHTHGRSTEYRFLPDGTAYQIPLGALLPAQGPPNLLVAGRCLSADHDASASCRVMAPCMAMGEAAGTVAAMAAADAVPVAAVPVADVQASLRDNGAVLDS